MFRKINLFILKGMLFWLVVLGIEYCLLYFLQLPNAWPDHRQARMCVGLASLYTLVYYPFFWHWTRQK